MKKLGVLVLLAFLVVLPFITAQEEGVGKAYTCLEDEIANKTSESLSLEEAVFSTLALGSKSKLTDKIESERSNQNCWPESSCTIKDTSQALLAYDSIGKSTTDIEEYLYSRNDSATDLIWYLQIDISNHNTSSCTISYDSNNHNVRIEEDMRLSSGAGNCLSLSESGYWLQISRTCYGKNFEVSCDRDFVTSLLYQKSGSQTVYVSPEAHSSASSGTTEESVESQCFKTSSSCDYEGTLWAAIALKQAGEEIKQYLPYLLALSEDNQRLFPSSFLHILTAGDDQYNEVVQQQTSSGFWEAPNTKYNKFYDTSLGLLSLQGKASAEFDTAINYLLSVQTPRGCWNNNNVRDTAFLLYSGWPRGHSGPGDGGGELTCAEAGLFCGSQFECAESQGQVFPEYSCPGFQSCCSVPLIQQTCAEKSGDLCSSQEACSGTEVSSADGSCCLGVCQPRSSDITECQEFGGFCSSSCQDNEEQASYSCGNSGGFCCIPKESSSGSFGWIIILIILIILAALAIIFRHKLQMMWYKFKHKGNKDSGSQQPSIPRAPPRFPPTTQPPIRRPQLIRRPVSRPKSKIDKEMEDTLKKLREMSS